VLGGLLVLYRLFQKKKFGYIATTVFMRVDKARTNITVLLVAIW